MLIYRFEDLEGAGPYTQSEHYFTFAIRHDNNFEKYPSALYDKTFSKHIPSKEELSNFYYGFSSIKQAKRWFNSQDISDMYDVEIFCYAYEVQDDCEDLFLSDKQVLFKKTENKQFIQEEELLSQRFMEKRDRNKTY
jgi:hypothetical protein